MRRYALYRVPVLVAYVLIQCHQQVKVFTYPEEVLRVYRMDGHMGSLLLRRP